MLVSKSVAKHGRNEGGPGALFHAIQIYTLITIKLTFKTFSISFYQLIVFSPAAHEHFPTVMSKKYQVPK